MFRFTESLRAGDRLLLKTAALVAILSLGWFLLYLNGTFLVNVPLRGGTYTEGVIGTPRFINPVLAVTTADRDLSALVYAGLMRLGEGGGLTPDMAETVTVSSDGLVYNVLLRPDLSFHDGEPVTSDDVIFTVGRIQDPALKSPLRASWEGVTLERISEKELNIILPEPYGPFIENLTIGILPRHVWESATAEEFPFSQYNSEPIGSGPYRISRIERDASGIPEAYVLSIFDDVHGTPPKIEVLRLTFYLSEQELLDAFLEGEIEGASGLGVDTLETLRTGEVAFALHSAPLPRTFAVFFNQNEAPLFRDEAVRRALEKMVNRSSIIENVLGEYGEPITSPVPPGFDIPLQLHEEEDDAAMLDAARAILREDGWKLNEDSGLWEYTNDDDETTVLRFSISTANTPVFSETAELLKERWEELGAEVTVRQFEQSDLTQTVIRPRKYQTLLFGTVVGRELDFFSFWHSSQRNDPGLNVALYANITADALLAKARATHDRREREEAYLSFAEEISNEIPAIFLYVPSFLYVTSPDIEGITLRGVADPSERFASIREWYIEQQSVWRGFTRE